MAQTVRKDFREHSQTLGLETMVNTMVKRVTGSGIVSCKKKKKRNNVQINAIGRTEKSRKARVLVQQSTTKCYFTKELVKDMKVNN